MGIKVYFGGTVFINVCSYSNYNNFFMYQVMFNLQKFGCNDFVCLKSQRYQLSLFSKQLRARKKSLIYFQKKLYDAFNIINDHADLDKGD